MKWTVCLNTRAIASWLPLVVFVVAINPGCEVPGCGPGDIPRNPISSNMVDFTVPAPGSVARWAGTSRLEFFRIYFLRSMNTASFSIEDDLAMCRIPAGAGTCDPADPGQALDAGEFFTHDGWSSYGHLVYGILKLRVKGEAFEEGSYVIRLLANGGTPLESERHERLEDDVDIYLKVVPEHAHWQMVTIDSNTLVDGIYFDYYQPHHPLIVRFSVPMHVINFVAEPLGGFYFRYVYGEDDPQHPVGIESRSAQGLLPGQQYTFSILSKDAMPNGVPWTMDVYGNVLIDSTTLRSASYSKTFETSHVRIYFPYQEAFSDEPAPWLEQQQSIGHGGELFVLVEVYKDVDLLTAEGPGNRRSHIYFADRPVTLDEKKDEHGRVRERSVIRIDIDPDAIEECAKTEDGYDYTMEVGHRQALEVFAWHKPPGGSKEFLGSDRIQVDPLPEGFKPDLPSGYRFLGDYPSDSENGFSHEVQGVAHDSNYWYFSKNEPSQIWKVPKYAILDEVGQGSGGVNVVSIDDTPLASEGYDHFGDIDYIPLDEYGGYVIVPVEKNTKTLVPKLAFFYTSREGEEIYYVGADYLLAQRWDNRASWCAYNPTDGMIYSSTSEYREDPRLAIQRYSFDDISFTLSPEGSIYLADDPGSPGILELDENGAPKLDSIQGGVFSSLGNLYLVTGDGKAGIWVFIVDDTTSTATLVNASCEERGSWCGEFVFGYGGITAGGEAEGIDIWDFENDPSYEPLCSLNSKFCLGQMHVIVLNNDAFHDNWFLKHYAVAPEEKCMY
ncbi:MAG: hypothetical protein D6806_04530 [Deltaproteobacteria bacterium]|nr:MAG: hypothetical protein D6806_04530 [Deltaproteobacteria bacterium]